MIFLKSIVSAVLYKPLFNLLILLVWIFPGHYVAFAIIVVTIIIRVILLPSSMKASRQQIKMRNLQPEIQELQAKYKDDKQKQSQELMKFYKEKNINPLGSCLPLLIQLPILLILYYVFKNGLDTSHFGLIYPFIPKPEFINTNFFGIDLAQKERWILPIIAGVLQFVQGWQLTPKNQPGQKQEMSAMVSKQMLYLMPVFTVFIAGSLPAALPLYWIITTAFSVVQQWVVLKEKPRVEKGEKRKEKRDINSDDDKKENKTNKRGVEVTVRRKK